VSSLTLLSLQQTSCLILNGLDLGFFKIHFYSLMFVVAFGLGYYIMKKIYKREGLTQDQLDKIFIYAIVSILVGARMGKNPGYGF